MKVTHNNRKLKKMIENRNISDRQKKIIEKEIQLLEAVETFVEYRNWPVVSRRRCHALKGALAGYYATCIDHKYRMISDPGESGLNSKEVTIIEYFVDYH